MTYVRRSLHIYDSHGRYETVMAHEDSLDTYKTVMAHGGPTWPGSGLGFQVKALQKRDSTLKFLPLPPRLKDFYLKAKAKIQP